MSGSGGGAGSDRDEADGATGIDEIEDDDDLLACRWSSLRYLTMSVYEAGSKQTVLSLLVRFTFQTR